MSAGLRPQIAIPALFLTLAFLPAPVAAEKAAPPLGQIDPAEATVDAACAALPDPAGWSLDPETGSRYRRATLAERVANGWTGTNFLVERGNLANAPRGHHKLNLLVPRCLGDPLHYHLTLLDSEPAPPAVEFRLDGSEVLRDSVSHLYATKGLDAFLARKVLTGSTSAVEAASLLSTSGAGFYARVIVPCIVEAHILGPEPLWVVEGLSALGDKVFKVQIREILNPGDCDGGDPPKPQCSDGRDNDGDRWTDYPNDPGCANANDDSEFDAPTQYTYVTMGEVKFCTTFVANWDTLMNTQALETEDGFAANGGTRAEPVHRYNGCWMAQTIPDANSCANNGGCQDAQGHAYTYNGCGTSHGCYLDRAWDDVAHLRLHFSFDAMKLVQGIHNGVFAEACGAAYEPSGTHPAASVVHGWNTGGGCDTQHTSTHEMGHNFEAQHGLSTRDAAGCWDVMVATTEPCVRNDFNDANRKKVNECVTDASCPRSGTG